MKIKEVRSVIDIIRDASKSDLIIVSLFLLPILLVSWSIFLDRISYLDQHHSWKLAILIVISSIYVLGLIIMKCCDPPDEKLKRAKLHIKTDLSKEGEGVLVLWQLERKLMQNTLMISSRSLSIRTRRHFAQFK